MKNIILFFLLAFTASAQYPAAQNEILFAKANVKPEFIQLRWLPTNYTVWRLGNIHGYKVYRTTIARNKQFLANPEKVLLTQQAIKPVNKAVFESMPGQKTDLYKMMLGLLYGTAVSDTLPASRTNTELKDAQDLQLYFVGQAADNQSMLANLMGLGFVDQTQKPGELYQYTIEPQAFKNDAIVLNVNPDVVSVPFGVPGQSLTYQNNVVNLTWDQEPNAEFSSYLIERSSDGGNTYQVLNKQPIVVSLPEDTTQTAKGGFTDSIQVLQETYLYRIRGVNMFAEYSPRQKPLEIYAHQCFVPQPSQLAMSQITKEGLEIAWTFPDTMTPYIQGFHLYRSAYPDSAFVPINPVLLNKGVRTYKDTKPLAEGFYKVGAVNEIGEVILSLRLGVQLEDSTGPAPVRNLSGKIDKNGIVYLQWPKDTTERVTYQVFRSDKAKGTYDLVSTTFLTDSLFQDTVSTRLLNKDIYYTLRAYDLRSNPSLSGDTLLLKRPDFIPPTAPLFYHYHITDSSIVLQWHPSSSTDVAFYQMVRTPLSDTAQSCVLLHFDAASQRKAFTDTSMAEGTEYRYQLVAYDDAGLHSEPTECQITLKKLKTTVRKAMNQIKVEYFKDPNRIELSWEYPADKVEEYVIYRRKSPNQKLHEFAHLKANMKTYRDENVEINVAYQYQIMAILKDGTTTALSQPYFTYIPE